MREKASGQRILDALGMKAGDQSTYAQFLQKSPNSQFILRK